MLKLLQLSVSHIYLKLLLAVVIATACAVFLLGGCTAANRNNERDEGFEGFAIYLTKDDIPVDRMDALSHIVIADQPVISEKDIIAYNAQTHETKLTDSAFESLSQLEVPVSGKSFTVCVDKQPVYWGAFWTPISSLSFNGVVILKPLDSEENRTITLELGYPSTSFYSGQDPRSDQALMKSLENAGKLVDKMPPTETDKQTIEETDMLPLSFKGYELYSWEEDNNWHFTLITGTNRTKTIEEVTSKNDSFTGTGLLKIHVVGADKIKEALSQLTRGESVFWCDELHIGQTSDANINLKLPPEDIVEDIEEHAGQCGLNLAITARCK